MVVPFWIQNALPKVFGIGVRQRVGADKVQLGVQFGDFGACGSEGNRAGIALSPQRTGIGEEFT